MTLAKDFYTPGTLFSLTGSATAVWIMTSLLGYLVPGCSAPMKKWFGFLLSIVFSFLGASLVGEHSVVTWVLAFVNGCLIYLTAVGTNTIVASSGKAVRERSPIRETSATDTSASRGFREPWWSNPE